MNRLAAVVALMLLPVAAVAQPVCTANNPNAIQCQDAAVNLLGTDVLAGAQQTGPQRSNQTVSVPISALPAAMGGPFLPLAGGTVSGLTTFTNALVTNRTFTWSGGSGITSTNNGTQNTTTITGTVTDVAALASANFAKVNTALVGAGQLGWSMQLNRSGGSGGDSVVDIAASNAGFSWAIPVWASGTPYTLGQHVRVTTEWLVATSSGTSGVTTPTCSFSPSVPTCSDGVVSWASAGTFSNAQQLIAVLGRVNIVTNYGGTATGPVGSGFGSNFLSNCKTTFLVECVGQEIDFGISATGSAKGRVGQQIIIGAGASSQGADYDVGWRIGAQSSAIPLRNLMTWGSATNPAVIDAAGYGLQAYPSGGGTGTPVLMAGAGAIDMAEFAPTASGPFGAGFILRGPNSLLFGTGDQSNGPALMHVTAAGATMDANMQHMTSAVVHAGGGGTNWTASGKWARCADGSALLITGVSGGAVTTVSIVLGAWSASPPANPVTCTSEQPFVQTDTGFLSFPSTFTVDETWALANGGAPVLTIGGTATLALSPSGGATTVGGTLTTAGASALTFTNGLAAVTAGQNFTLNMGGNGNTFVISAQGGHGTILGLTSAATNLATTNAAWTYSQSLFANKQATSWSGAMLSGSTSPMFLGTNLSGTVTGAESALFGIVVSSDVANTDAVSNSSSGLLIQTNFGGADGTRAGALAQGGRNGIRVLMTQNGAMNPKTPPATDFFTPITGSVTMGWNTGGTDTTNAGSSGAVIAASTYVRLTCVTLASACATNYHSGVGYEPDHDLHPNTSVFRKAGVNVVSLATDMVYGSGADSAFGVGVQTGVGYLNGLLVGADPGGTGWPLDQYGGSGNLISLVAGGATVRPVLHAVDAAAGQFHGSVVNSTHYQDFDLGVTGITSATRLTTDGKAAGSITGVRVTHGSTGYSGATGTVAGCGSTPSVTPNVITDAHGGGSGIIGTVTVNTVGGNCVAPTISFTGGSGATATVMVADNAMSLLPNTTVTLDCKISANSAAGDSIGWSETFGAAQGANAAATTVVGAGAFTQTFASAGAAAKISIGTPTADTTNGAVSIVVTPSSSTWSVGGHCTVTRTI